MSKDRKESTKKHLKKAKATENQPHNALDTFLKSQQNVIAQLKRDLQNSNNEIQQSISFIGEKNQCIVDLEKNLQERDSEIEKLHSDVKQLKDENTQTLKDFLLFRDKFYELETHYDKLSQMLNRDIHELKEKLHKQQTDANREIQELSSKCDDLQQQLLVKSQSVMKLNEQLLENMRNFDQMKNQFERQQKDFEFYKSKVVEEKRTYDENNNIEFAKLKDEISHKDEIIKQCLLNKDNLEKEKNRIIEELNYKIRRIERAFTQPTKVVQPIAATPNTTNEIKSNQNIAEHSSNDNVAVTRPQVREPLDNVSLHHEQSTINNENEESNSNSTQRPYKFKRPNQVQPTVFQNSIAASTSNSNNYQPIRLKNKKLNLPATAFLNEFSSSSSDEDESDDSVVRTQWRPKKLSFVPDSSDASEGFSKPKRFKK